MMDTQGEGMNNLNPSFRVSNKIIQRYNITCNYQPSNRAYINIYNEQTLKLEIEHLLCQIAMHEETLVSWASTKTRKNIHKTILQKVRIRTP